jgi:lysophospholipase L1-like esterase
MRDQLAIEIQPANARPLDAISGNAPSKLGPFWFGKWWYWREYPAHSFVIDDIRPEPAIPLDTADHTPVGAPLARTLAKLKAGQPLSIATMGDSLTDFAHWANKRANWPTMLLAKLRSKFGSEITHINPAVGGSQLPQGLVLLPRWTPRAPDLVTILYGYNDWDGGTRGPQFAGQMRDAIECVRRVTGGKSDVLIITTCPALERWETMSELSAVCREAARACNAGLADTEHAFHAVAPVGRVRLFLEDKAHLAAPDHELVAGAVFDAFANDGGPQ